MVVRVHVCDICQWSDSIADRFGRPARRSMHNLYNLYGLYCTDVHGTGKCRGIGLWNCWKTKPTSPQTPSEKQGPRPFYDCREMISGALGKIVTASHRRIDLQPHEKLSADDSTVNMKATIGTNM